MIITNLIIGLLFVGIGFLVKYQPNVIAGYNTMSREKKKNVDIDGLSAFMKKGFIILGILIMISSVFTKISYFEAYVPLIMIFLILVGVVVIVIKAQKYDHNVGKYRKIFTYVVPSVIVVLVASLAVSGSMPTKVIFEEEKVQFTGRYGFDLKLSDIKTVELVDKIPAVKTRTNGFSAGTVKKGQFRLASWGKCWLLINSNNPPFLIITKNDGTRIIFNNKEKSVTENAYMQIRLMKE